MDKTTALKIVREFRSALEERGIRVVTMVLFGSYAAGIQSEGSDIDVIVVSNDFKGLNHWQRIERMSDALYKIFQPIEARALTSEEWESNKSLTVNYVKSGVSIII